jgi:hypothetical protein
MSAEVFAMKFDQFTLVLLVRPPDAPELSDEEADALQDAHLAFVPTCATRATSSAAARSSIRMTNGSAASQSWPSTRTPLGICAATTPRCRPGG